MVYSTTLSYLILVYLSLALMNAKPSVPEQILTLPNHLILHPKLERSFRPRSSHPIILIIPSNPHSVLRDASGMPAETCPQMVRVGRTTTAHSPSNMSITRFGSEAQHHASPPR